MKELFLVGRLLLGGFLLYSASQHFTSVTTLASHAAAKGVPAPTLAVLFAGLLLLVGGVTLLLGIAPRVGIVALVLFFVPVTLWMHAFWAEEGQARAADLVNFSKNVAILGSVIMLVAVPEPWPYSAEARARVRREAGVHP